MEAFPVAWILYFCPEEDEDVLTLKVADVWVCSERDRAVHHQLGTRSPSPLQRLISFIMGRPWPCMNFTPSSAPKLADFPKSPASMSSSRCRFRCMPQAALICGKACVLHGPSSPTPPISLWKCCCPHKM